jgi:4-aminobutyrate aminotransferase/(S)-3-amino-2-methylpropionate transaminase
VIGRAEIMDESNPGELGGTYCGSPLGCEAALAVLDIIEEEKLNERGEYLGKVVTSRFEKLAEKYDCIGDIRGLGAMSAIELVKDRETKEADKELTQRIVKEANKRGLLLLSAGVFGNVLRILMPIVITDEQLEEGLAIFEAALEASVQQTVEV